MERDLKARTWIRAVVLLLAAGLIVALPAPLTALPGVIAFRDDCTGLLYAVRADGSGRIALPLPPRPLPTDDYRNASVLDVTTSGPLTVVYNIDIVRIENYISTVVDYGLFAVQVNDVGGALTPDPLVRLSLPEIAGVDPNRARVGSLSPAGSGDRLALVAGSPTAKVLMTARVERDVTMGIIGLSDLVVVGDLYSIGPPFTGFPASQGFTGDIDYSPDGNSIAASIYGDLWRIHLGADNTYLSDERLTESSGFVEWKPFFSPDGSRIAYTRAAVSSSGLRDPDIYSLTLATGVVAPVTTNKNKGSAASSRNNAMWSPDSAWIGFQAYAGGRTPRNSPCSGPVNSEIFLIRADGSTTATQITNTNGTSVEAWPRWGW
ncbi:MAG: hypothetical protein M3542_09875 [Acidobacteriota bacterium]|nr:hypothetical protein [Acidobacteriota bacterium]MDQ5871409.1 hypothetical protein [Acidobacteriota bacterium]